MPGAERLGNQVMYIPAVPLTPQNQAYIERQKAKFLSGESPPDFSGKGEATFVGLATVNDVDMAGRRAMGLLQEDFSTSDPNPKEDGWRRLFRSREWAETPTRGIKRAKMWGSCFGLAN